MTHRRYRNPDKFRMKSTSSDGSSGTSPSDPRRRGSCWSSSGEDRGEQSDGPFQWNATPRVRLSQVRDAGGTHGRPGRITPRERDHSDWGGLRVHLPQDEQHQSGEGGRRQENGQLQGMRDASVPKILYILSDGRTHDFPKDWEMSDIVRRYGIFPAGSGRRSELSPISRSGPTVPGSTWPGRRC